MYTTCNTNIVEFNFTVDNVYDRLDFLRPAKSWKPHYQKPAVMQERENSSGSNDNSRCINCSKNSGLVQQKH